MKRTRLTLGLLLAAPALAWASAVEPRDERELFASALRLELTNLFELSLPGRRTLGRIASLGNTKAKSLAPARLFASGTLNPQTGFEDPVVMAHVPLSDQEVGAAVLVAINPERGSFLGAAVLAADGRAIETWGHFLEGLRFADPPVLETARSAKDLAKLERKLARKRDEDSRLSVTLLQLMRSMQEQAKFYNLPGDPQRSWISDAAAAYDRIAELAPELEPFMGDGAQVLASKAQSVAAEVRAAGALADDGQAIQAMWKVARNCKSCHDMTGAWDGKLKDALAAKRRELGIGDDYFLVGYDLRLRHGDRKRAQTVADAVRVAALLATSAE